MDRYHLPNRTPEATGESMLTWAAGLIPCDATESSEVAMPFPPSQFITWLIVGLLGGSAAAMVVKRQRKGFGLGLNLALGVLGAVVGGALFRLFKIFPNLDQIAVSLRDLLAAFLGSLLVLAAVWAWQYYVRRA
jgi:uncharacterized membrane protein YeaQ/YmgE (transglycosylase-associated protein family)